MKATAGSRIAAVTVGLLLQSVLLLDLAIRSIPHLAGWQRIDQARRLLAAGKPVDHSYMSFLPNTTWHFGITLVQFGYLSIAFPAALAALLVGLTLWIRAFSLRARLTIAIVEVIFVLIALIAVFAQGEPNPLLFALAALVSIFVLSPTRWDRQVVRLAPG